MRLKRFTNFSSKRLDWYFLIVSIAVVVVHNLIFPIPKIAQWWILGILLITTGIPHGAIDAIIYKNNNKEKDKYFYLKYLGIALVIGLVWAIAPGFAFITFLLLSAYHFGQSQLFHYRLSEKGFLKNALYLLWGMILLSAFIIFHKGPSIKFINELLGSGYQEFINQSMLWIFIGSSLAFILLSFLAVSMKQVRIKIVLTEFVYLGILITMFMTTPAVLAFALYFGLWHSLKTMAVEYKNLSLRQKKISIGSFAKQIFPFSLMSFGGLILVYFVYAQIKDDISIVVLVFVAISILTFPHSWVMNMMYGNLKKT